MTDVHQHVSFVTRGHGEGSLGNSYSRGIWTERGRSFVRHASIITLSISNASFARLSATIGPHGFLQGDSQRKRREHVFVKQLLMSNLRENFQQNWVREFCHACKSATIFFATFLRTAFDFFWIFSSGICKKKEVRIAHRQPTPRGRSARSAPKPAKSVTQPNQWVRHLGYRFSSTPPGHQHSSTPPSRPS